jgi:hypothetical protein
MAELFGIVSGGIGVAAFALQLETSIDQLRDRVRRLSGGAAAADLDHLSGRLELLKSTLEHLKAFEGHHLVDRLASNSSLQLLATEVALSGLRQKVPDGVTMGKGKRRWRKFRLSSKQVEEQMKEIDRRIDSMSNDVARY